MLRVGRCRTRNNVVTQLCCYHEYGKCNGRRRINLQNGIKENIKWSNF